MPTVLDRRPPDRGRAESPPEIVLRVAGERRGVRGGRSLLNLAVVGSILGAIVLILGSMTGLLSLDFFSSRTIDRSPPVLLKQLSNLAEFHAAQGTFEATIAEEEDVPVLPSFIAGTKVVFVAVGTVDATVDFSDLGGEAVQVGSDGAVTITLPKPDLGRAVVDPRRSEVVESDRGLVERVAGAFEDLPTSERSLYLKAGKRLDRAARESRLLDRAEQNTTEMLRSLLGRLGFDRVTVTFAPPAAAAAPDEGTERPGR